jgi:hypothetical protein
LLLSFIHTIHRKLNLLGKDAVTFLAATTKGESRRRSAVTTQGFTNYFNVPSLAEGGDEEEEDEGDEEVNRSSHRPRRPDDLLARLRGTEGAICGLICG